MKKIKGTAERLRNIVRNYPNSIYFSLSLAAATTIYSALSGKITLEFLAASPLYHYLICKDLKNVAGENLKEEFPAMYKLLKSK